VGYLGRMENTKGIEVLLDAVKLLPPSQVTVLLGGSGDTAYVDDLQRTYAADNVRFIGFVKPADFFARIDVLVVPSVWEEPLGRVIYEGYAHGVPSFVSSVGGMPEIVNDGRTGFVFTSRDSKHLAALLQQQIDQGWAGARFFAECVERGRDFSTDRVFGDYLKVWETAIREQSGSSLNTGAPGLSAVATAKSAPPVSRARSA
jgi:glycosyltransferase involved in cell wall biosynthesis